jgi:hypothetical protein
MNKEVYNCNIGYIDNVDPNAREIVASFDGRSVTYGFGGLDMRHLHKSHHGSEYPAVVIASHRRYYGTMCLPLGHQKILFLQPADDLGSGRGGTDTFGFLQALPQNIMINKAPSILHRLDQSAFVVTRRWPGLLVLDFRIVQLRDQRTQSTYLFGVAKYCSGP